MLWASEERGEEKTWRQQKVFVWEPKGYAILEECDFLGDGAQSLAANSLLTLLCNSRGLHTFRAIIDLGLQRKQRMMGNPNLHAQAPLVDTTYSPSIRHKSSQLSPYTGNIRFRKQDLQFVSMLPSFMYWGVLCGCGYTYLSLRAAY